MMMIWQTNWKMLMRYQLKLYKVKEDFQNKVLTLESLTNGFKSRTGWKSTFLSIFSRGLKGLKRFRWTVKTFGALSIVNLFLATTFCLQRSHWYCFWPPSSSSSSVKFWSARTKVVALAISRLRSKKGSNLLEQCEHRVHFTCKWPSKNKGMRSLMPVQV